MKRVRKIKGMLHMLGIDPARLEFFNLSAAQGPRWAEICTTFTAKITALGPSPIWLALRHKKKSADDENKAEAARGGTSDFTEQGVASL